MDNERWIDVEGVATRYFEAGNGETVVVLVHGGTFSSDGLCPSALVWELNVAALARDFRVIALDTLGQGRTGQPRRDEDYSLQAMIRHVRDFLTQCGIAKAHLVGHDEGGLIAVRLALDHVDAVASCTIVNSPAVAPAGDGIGNLTLLAPLRPLYSAAGQRWVLEQCSYSPHHITATLIDEAVNVSQTEGFRTARAKMDDADLYKQQVLTDLSNLRSDNFARLRDRGIDVPLQLIWGYQDPMAPVHYGRTLHTIIAPHADIAQLKLINRAGYMPFRERPRIFNEMVRGFVRASQR